MLNVKSFKTWIKIAKPNKWLFFWQFLTAVIPAVLSIISTIPAAKTINYLSVYDYYNAKQQLILIIIFLSIEFIFWNINYILYPQQLKTIYKKIQDCIFQKILLVSDEELKINSKEKMMSILSTNMNTMATFTDTFTKKISHLITSLVTLSIIFYYKVTLGLITSAIAIFSYLLYSVFNSFLAKQTLKIQNSRDEVLENFSYVVDGRSLSSDLNLIPKLKEKYDNSVNNMIKTYKKEHILKLFSNKWVWFIYKILIFGTTFYLISLVEKNIFSLTIYLLLTPYISSAIENFFTFFDMIYNLSEAKIASQRIKTIQDMSETDLISFGKNSTTEIDGNIIFSNISFSPDSTETIYGKINLTSFNINKNSLNAFIGEKSCGKRALFYMLRRKLRPTTGTITFDTINIYDFEKTTYVNNFSYTTSYPYFFNDTILNNLKFINKSIKKIKAVTKFLNIDTIIENLPNGYNTNIMNDSVSLSSYLKFMIGIARVILSESEIISIYEFPIGLTKEEIQNIMRVLKDLKKSHTIIIFCAINPLKEITDQSFFVQNGDIKRKNIV